ncbi:serine/threonine-protein kinase, partial [Jatrophihabitans sp.]|uniref:serine/threonine-protein kinase n=1 Tax=Jatrophihabitans sp. TaxID=1932789 RepID=UPI002EEF5614
MSFTVPGYQVDQLIGYGSHAEVWSGRIAGTAEPVALKRIIVPVHGDPDRAAQLIRSARTEAALLTALQHPSLIRLRQYVQTPAAVVLVMELAEGGSLAQLLRRRDRLSPAEVSAALSPIAAALAFAHSEGVLHGDVSAANILFSATGQPKLADLGVARMLVGQAGADRSLGTPAYVDPVVAAGGAAGAASDVFSLAAVALHCVTG